MPKHIFIIGPGGVGKTTSGKALADLLGIPFFDLDQEFISRIGHIGAYIAEHGYETYCSSNSLLFSKLLQETEVPSVFALSSGFLAHEGLDALVDEHKKLQRTNGTSILLLPSRSLEESTNIVVQRQLQRGLGLQEEKEKLKFTSRYDRYKSEGDLQVYSTFSPLEIAAQIASQLRGFHKF